MNVENAEKSSETAVPHVADPDWRAQARVRLPEGVSVVQAGELVGVNMIASHDLDSRVSRSQATRVTSRRKEACLELEYTSTSSRL